MISESESDLIEKYREHPVLSAFGICGGHPRLIPFARSIEMKTGYSCISGSRSAAFLISLPTVANLLGGKGYSFEIVTKLNAGKAKSKKLKISKYFKMNPHC